MSSASPPQVLLPPVPIYILLPHGKVCDFSNQHESQHGQLLLQISNALTLPRTSGPYSIIRIVGASALQLYSRYPEEPALVTIISLWVSCTRCQRARRKPSVPNRKVTGEGCEEFAITRPWMVLVVNNSALTLRVQVPNNQIPTPNLYYNTITQIPST